MSKIKPILASICVVAVAFLGYDDYRLRNLESEPSPAQDGGVKQEQQVSALETHNRELQTQLVIAQTKADNLGKYIAQANQAATTGNAYGPGYGTAANGMPANGAPAYGAPAYAAGARPDDGSLVPASQVAAVRRITPLSPDELAQLVQNAYQRTPESLTAVTQSDLASMGDNFEWGTGDARRMWHMTDASTYQEVYPDGSYSVFSVLGRTTVNGVPGVIAAKDDGALDAFIPDKGSDHMVISLRGSGPQSQWVDYRPMQNSQ